MKIVESRQLNQVPVQGGKNTVATHNIDTPNSDTHFYPNQNVAISVREEFLKNTLIFFKHLAKSTHAFIFNFLVYSHNLIQAVMNF